MRVLAGAVAARLDGDDAEIEARRVGRPREELHVPDTVTFTGPDDHSSLSAHHSFLLACGLGFALRLEAIDGAPAR